MKKTLTLALILGLTTALSAQYLHRTEKVTGKQWSRTDQFLINLDTMPDIQFAFVRLGNRWGTSKTFTFDIGDGFKWELVDKDSKLIEADNMVEGFNLLYRLNWVYHSAIVNVSVLNGLGSTSNDLLFKRREGK